MSELPRARGYTLWWWLDWLVILLVLGIVILGGCLARGDEAESALALAKVRREREQAKTVAKADDQKSQASPDCYTDPQRALDDAHRLGKNVVIWVNTSCKDHKEFRTGLNDAIHLHMKSQRKDATPRVIIADADGTEWFIYPEHLTAAKAVAVKRKWAEPKSIKLAPQTNLIEELTWLYIPPPQMARPMAMPMMASDGC